MRRELYEIDDSDPEFMYVRHESIRDRGRDMGGPMWFERENLGWVVDTLRSCLTVYAFPRSEIEHGHDRLRVYESGDEQAPIINLLNTRPPGTPHAGVYALMMLKPVAARLLSDLAAIAGR